MVPDLESLYRPLKHRLRSHGITGLCSDVDDTLCATNLFWAQHHIDAYGAPPGSTAGDVIRMYGFVKDVPWWQDNEEARDWVDAHLESIEAKLELPVMEGALEGVIELQRTSRLALYLTARSQATDEGTRKWMGMHGFPDLPIISYPRLAASLGLADRNKWKARVLEYLYPEVQGIIEDNQAVIEGIDPAYKGVVYHLSHEAQRAPNVVCCANWDDVVREIGRRRV